MGDTTGIAVGCAVGIPSFVAICVAVYFFVKTRKRLEQEDIEFQKDEGVANVNQDLSYDNLDQLRESLPVDVDHSESSDDGKVISEKSPVEPGSPQQKEKRSRYVPAYRKQMKSSMTSVNNSRSSSVTNLQPPIGQQQPQQALGSNSSINSSNTNATNLTDHFYSNVPVLDSEQNIESTHNSIDLARSLQGPTPSYGKKSGPMQRSSSTSTFNDEYDLKNNYNVENENEIQEEDQYENEFTNYTENKRAFIEGLRPKIEQ